MSGVCVTARIENLRDLQKAGQGNLARGEVRSIEVTDATIDTSHAMLLLPEQVIKRLGLHAVMLARMPHGGNEEEREMFESVRVTIGSHNVAAAAALGDAGQPVTIGRAPLDGLGLEINDAGQLVEKSDERADPPEPRSDTSRKK